MPSVPQKYFLEISAPSVPKLNGLGGERKSQEMIALF